MVDVCRRKNLTLVAASAGKKKKKKKQICMAESLRHKMRTTRTQLIGQDPDRATEPDTTEHGLEDVSQRGGEGENI